LGFGGLYLRFRKIFGKRERFLKDFIDSFGYNFIVEN